MAQDYSQLTPYQKQLYAPQIAAGIPVEDIMRDSAQTVNQATKSLSELEARYAQRLYAKQNAPGTMSQNELADLEALPGHIQRQKELLQTYSQNYGTTADFSGQGGTVTGANLTAPGATATEASKSLYNPNASGTTYNIMAGATQTPAGNVVAAAGGPTKDSELARAGEVYNNADKLAGTGKYVGQTADQIREAAHNYANDVRANKITFDSVAPTNLPPGTQGGTSGGAPSPTNPPSAGGTSTGASGANQATPQNPEGMANGLAVLNQYLNNGTIDSGTYQFFKKALEAWTPGQQADFANILNTFETIKQNDINPYFKEQANLFINDLQTNREYLQGARALETEQERSNATALKENMQEDLAARGMLFTGKAIKQLGAESPFAVAGTPEAAASAIPITAFGGEGELQKQTRVASSSSALRYQKSLKDLQQQAESTLGSTASSGLIPGTSQIGGITGSLVNQEKQAQGSALTGLYNQQQQNRASQAPEKLFNE